MSLVKVSGNASGTGTLTIAAPNTNSDYTLTLPTNTGTLISTGSTGQVIPKAALPAGSVLQVVHGTFATSTSLTGTTPTATGITATITPTSSTSKILATVFIPSYNQTAGTNAFYSLYRNGSNLNQMAYFQNGGNTLIAPFTAVYYDSPATTSATTYAIYATQAAGGTITWAFGGLQCNITLMEIAV